MRGEETNEPEARWKRAAGREITRERRDADQARPHAEHHGDMRARGAEQHSLQNARSRKCAGTSEDGAGRLQEHPAVDGQAQHIGPLRSEGESGLRLRHTRLCIRQETASGPPDSAAAAGGGEAAG